VIRQFAVLLLAAAACAADPVSLANEGIRLAVPKVGPLTLSWPTLAKKGSSERGEKPAVKLAAGRATLTYGEGIVVEARLVKAGIELTFNQAPAEGTNLRADLELSKALRGAITWQIGDKKGEFPAEKPAKPFLFQGNATSFFLLKGADPVLDITTPEWAYQQLQDNREWKSDQIQWWFHAPVMKDRLTMVIGIKAGK